MSLTHLHLKSDLHKGQKCAKNSMKPLLSRVNLSTGLVCACHTIIISGCELNIPHNTITPVHRLTSFAVSVLNLPYGCVSVDKLVI